MVFGGVMTYKTHFEHPQLSYIPTDDTWRQHLDRLVALAQEQTPTASPSNVLVEVSGAVQRPGVYSLSPGSRVQDVILQANGFLDTASQKYIHQELKLAEKAVDQEKIYIPFVEEELNQNSSFEKGMSPLSDLHISENRNINQATQRELESVSGIGEKRAEQILEAMPFTGWSDFQQRVSIPANILAELQKIYAF